MKELITLHTPFISDDYKCLKRQRFFFKFSLFILFIISNICKADWVNQNTGIIDDLNGVRFWGSSKGIISGEHGIYYTTNNVLGSGGTWTRFNIIGNHADSLIYNSTHFYKTCSTTPDISFICGWDSSTNKSIIFRFNLDSLTYSIPYVGNTGSKLNFITFESGGIILLSCGDNGLIVRSSDMINFTVENSGTINNLYCITSNGNSVYFGGNGIYINGTENGTSLSLTPHSYPSLYLKSFLWAPVGTGGIGLGTAIYTFSSDGNSYSINNDFDFGPLNCLSSTYNSVWDRIATDHGIFRPAGSNPVYEYETSSLDYSLNDIYSQSGGDAYAVGKNGLFIMASSSGSGAAKPYCTFNLTGACQNIPAFITGIYGSATGYAWYVDGAYITNSNNLYRSFSTVGSHTVTYIVSNQYNYVYNYDTATRVIQIIPAPPINTLVTYNDTFLCKSQPIILNIDSTQNNFNYYLYQTGTTNSFGAAVGNGGILTFTSNNISAGGNYNIMVSSPTYECVRNYTDTIKLIVEHTKANFHATKANVTSGESTIFYQHCSEAVNYQWLFSPSANPPNSFIPYQSVTFGSLGNTQATLICSSSHGCYDTIRGNGPTVYADPSTPDSCWTMVNDGADPPWGGSYNPDINKLSPSKTGFFTCGYFNQEQFASRYGDSLILPTTSGAYTAKYNQNGVLKWMVNTNLLGDIITSVVEDNSGHIYLCGNSYGCFLDNKGDTTYFPNTSEEPGFIAKLDSIGRLIWMLRGAGIYPKDLTMINGSSLIVSQSINPTNIIPLSLNGLPTDTLKTVVGSEYFSNLLLKIDSSGRVIWNIGMYISQGGIARVGIDSSLNVYVSGNKETYVDIYPVGSTTYTTIAANYSLNYYWPSLFLAKFDSAGAYKWGINSDYSTPYDMITDSAGNCYISGRNEFAFYAAQLTYIFNNADSTTTSVDAGEYFIAKINTYGICKWIQGNVASYYGFGYSINKLGNEISVVGEIKDNSPNNIETNSFTSQNNDSISLTIGASDYFIAVYDTSGNLKSITKNGNNALTIMSNGDIEHINMFRYPDGSYFMTKNIEFYNGTHNYNNFGTIIDSCNGIDGSITRFTKSSGITFYPNTIVTGFESVSNNSNIIIYPNPNKGNFIIAPNSSTKQTIQVYDVNGKLVLTQIINGKTTIDASILSEGVYNISLINSEGVLNKRLVIVK